MFQQTKSSNNSETFEKKNPTLGELESLTAIQTSRRVLRDREGGHETRQTPDGDFLERKVNGDE